jgi:release factor glutamine methyltransferase
MNPDARGQSGGQVGGVAGGEASPGEASEQVREAYRAGTRTFMGQELLVSPGALVPRAETELLGRTAQRLLEEIVAGGAAGGQIQRLQVIDMCCGSGNLACGLAAGDQRLRVYAADLTDGCVDLARRNVSHLNLDGRVTVHQGDLFAALAGVDLAGGVDMIVCNPPYISTARLGKDRAALLEHEPISAFDGGPYGLSIHQRVIKDAPAYLKAAGHLLFEMGLGQERQIKLLFDRARIYKDVDFVKDADGRPRVAVAALA